MRRVSRSTPAGEHRAVMLDEVLDVLAPQPGQVAVDCTTGWAGHSAELLQRVGPDGLLVALDLDADNIPRARERLDKVGVPFQLHHLNFAGLEQALGEHALAGVDVLLADLGMSSMQVDDAGRGFSYSREGPLDMRMDRSKGRTAGQILASIGEDELCKALEEWGDEPHARKIAAAIVAGRGTRTLTTTRELSQLIQEVAGQTDWRLHPTNTKWNLHPAARTFQALRILVNRELSNLANLLRILPGVLKPNGRAALISFHSGEDRLIKAAFRDGHAAGIYSKISPDPIRPTYHERQTNPRSRSAKLRWAIKA